MASKKQKSEKSSKITSNYSNYLIIAIIAITCNYLITNLSYFQTENGSELLSKFPNCSVDLLNKDAQSAIKRAKTKECKQKIQETVCFHDNLYPKSLEPTCDFYEKLKYLGCFKDSLEKRIFNGTRFRLTNNNSPQACVKFCLDRRFSMAGVQFGFWCECGNSMASNVKVDESRCDKPCPGDSERKCGGELAMNIYKVRFDSVDFVNFVNFRG